MRHKVFVVHQKNRDALNAGTFGELRVIFREQVPDIFNVSRVAHLVKDALKDMDQDDYLLLGGNVLANVLAVLHGLDRFGTLNILMFDAKNNYYVPRTIAKHYIA
jgi:hypothetical protein